MLNLNLLEGDARAHVAGNYLVWTADGITHISFYPAGVAQAFASLLANVADLKLHGIKYVLRNAAKYQEVA
jgi:hypothetical protein